MTFDVDGFAQRPTMDTLQWCTKADLLLVANLFNVSVPLNAQKAEIKQCLAEQLVEKGITAKVKPRLVDASENLVVDVGAEAAATIPQAVSGWMTLGRRLLLPFRSQTLNQPVSYRQEWLQRISSSPFAWKRSSYVEHNAMSTPWAKRPRHSPLTSSMQVNKLP